MKKIIVAGAGHGGLSAAATLAANGLDVTVYERSSRDALGHDWHDICDKEAFRFADIPEPDEKDYIPGYTMAFHNPAHTVKLVRPYSDPENLSMMIDRKALSRHLVNYAESRGVKFVFGAEALGAVCDEDNRVVGLRVREEGEEKTVYADLVIDAAGMDSPVRKSLPEKTGIQREIGDNEFFCGWRAYFDNPTGQTEEPPYSVYFFDCGVPGMTWVITEPDYVDVLIGKFGELTDDEIEAGLASMRSEYPYMGDRIVRGGVQARIPVRRTLSKIVADGIALVGDSACMTVPMNGCGISLSIKAGKILANTVLGAGEGPLDTAALWSYQYKYYKFFGEKLVMIDKARQFFSGINDETVNFCLESGLITEKETTMTDGDFSDVGFQYILDKIKAIAPRLHKLPAVIAQFSSLHSFGSVFRDMPAQYDEKAFLSWRERYEKL